MKIIERYIFRRAFVVFAAALGWTLAIVWTTQVLERIDLVTTNGQSVLSFLELATLILPSVAPMVMPFAVALGVSQTLSVMNTDSELVVINASGSSRTTVIKPMLLLGLAVSLVSFVVDNAVDPYARQRARELVAEARADLLSTIIQEGTFRKVEDGLYLQIGERLANGTLGGIFVADSRDPEVELAYYAKNGRVARLGNQDVLLMQDGVVHRKRPGSDVSVVRFETYAFDLSLFAPQDQVIVMYPKDQTIPYLLNPDPNDYQFKRNPQQFRAELHRRFAEWTYPLIFALIAVAVAGDARSHREARIHPTLTVLTLALLVRWAGFIVANEAHTTAWLVPFIYGVPIITAAICIRFILANRTLELPQAFTERSAGLLRSWIDRIDSLRKRLRRNSHTAEGGV
ncbi:LPS export ABC transporter permease LptF [Arvimicrobium flavum]|uniref:LPS export ABC transporter permease LptF n=1 Tax=Arvimicrobium flavum TaxID=3393320 RepID=UPI00237A4623|nr:LPS export ABC transporter permease LptF [Mesorhizobium shangrilense]